MIIVMMIVKIIVLTMLSSGDGCDDLHGLSNPCDDDNHEKNVDNNTTTTKTK